MSGALKAALLLTAAGLVIAVYSLINTTALSMMMFFTVGLACFGLSFVIYTVEVFRDLRKHRVL